MIFGEHRLPTTTTTFFCLTNWNIVETRRYIRVLLLLMMALMMENLSCSWIYNGYRASNYWSDLLLSLVLIIDSTIVKVVMITVGFDVIVWDIVIGFTIITASRTTTTRTTAAYAAMATTRTNISWQIATVCRPLSYWRKSASIRWLCRYRNRGHIAWVNNRDCSVTSRTIGTTRSWLCALWVIVLMGLRLNWRGIIARRCWERIIWRRLRRCTLLDSFSMFGSLIAEHKEKFK